MRPRISKIYMYEKGNKLELAINVNEAFILGFRSERYRYSRCFTLWVWSRLFSINLEIEVPNKQGRERC